ncbi:MAG: O-methyltransferase [Spirochaetaceae bacterium]
MSSVIPKQLGAYLDELTGERPEELRRMEAYARRHSFPIIGPAAGQMCYVITRLLGARSVYELGSGYGYSTAWFAKAVRDNGGGVVQHVVWDEALSRMAREHLDRLGLTELLRYHVGEAVEALRRSDGPFDLIFNDIDKHAYPHSLPVIEEKLRPGGVLITDNMLWGGNVLDDADHSPDTEGVRELTRLITESDRWTSTIIPIRDGLIVARRE